MSTKKTISLGKIKNSKLVDLDEAALWNLDDTICIFLRDSIANFKEQNIGAPLEIYNKYKSEKDADTKAKEEWAGILSEIVGHLDYYLTPTKELLSTEDQEKLKEHDERTVDLFKTGGVLRTLSEPTPAEISDIRDREYEIAFSQKERLMKAFDLIKKWVQSMWI